VISTTQSEEVERIFREHAEASGSAIRFLGQEVEFSRRFQSGEGKGPHARICVGHERDGFEHMSVPLMGMHQADNCGLVLAIIIELRANGFDLHERMVAAGFEQIAHHGRLEEIYTNPRIVIDGAHTPESVRETLRAAGAHLDYDSLIVIFGCAMDKNVSAMLKELDRGADKVLFTRASGNPRAMDPDELLSRFVSTHSVMGESKASVKEAINDAARAAAGNDLILLLGSFYIAGEAKALVEERKARR